MISALLIIGTINLVIGFKSKKNFNIASGVFTYVVCLLIIAKIISGI